MSAALTLTLLSGLVSTSPSTDQVPEGMVDVVERLNEPVPKGLRFTDHTGKEVKFESLLHGKPVILAMVYYRCPVLCNLLMTGLTKSLQQLATRDNWKLGKEYEVISVSIDPGDQPADSAEKRRGMLQAMGEPKAEGWSFLTGHVDDIDTLSDAIGLRYQYVANQRQFAHVAALWVLTPEGRVSRYLYGVEFDPKQVKLALFEAADGKVGTSFERVLLRCYRYDPRSKKYEMLITRYYRAGGAVMVLLVGGLLFALWRRELLGKGGVA
jgi:protein SCO1/2